MKKYFLLLPLYLFAADVFAQTLSHVAISGASTLKAFSFITNQQVIIKITPEGNIIEWGIEIDASRNGYYWGKLDPYLGRIDYYGQEADEAFRGKVKSIGSCSITYYASSQPELQKGKIKTIGAIQLDYYLNYEDVNFQGKIKSAGNLTINYFSSYDNDSFKGKLKSVGLTSLTYYSIFDDRLNKGKIKSIGNYRIAWYNEFDQKELQGAMKSGSTMLKVNSVVYNIL